VLASLTQIEELNLFNCQNLQGSRADFKAQHPGCHANFNCTKIY